MDHSKVCGLPSSASRAVTHGVVVVTTQCHDWVSKEKTYTLRVCIFKVGRRLLAGCCIVYLNLEIFGIEYTLRVCIFFCFTRNCFLFHTEVFFPHGMHGNADASPAKILFLMFCFSQIIFFSRNCFLFHTECTECTEFTLRVPSGFEFSPTNFLTRLLLCTAIRVNSIALAYRNNSQILLIYTIWIYLVPTNLTNFCSLRFALTSVNRLDYTQHTV